MTQLKAAWDMADRHDSTWAAGGAREGASPLAVAEIRPGDVVLELGSGLGFDSFLAAHQVGPSGDVIGIDPSPELVARARANARAVAAINVTFLLGELEQLPVPDGSVDVVVSNETPMSLTSHARIREAFRVLRDGGRLAVRVIVDESVIAEPLASANRRVTSYLARTLGLEEVRATLRAAGFDAVTFHGTARHAKTAVAIKTPEGRSCCGPECCS